MHKKYIRALQQRIRKNPPLFGSVDDILEALYEAYSEANNLGGDEIKTGFCGLYAALEGLSLPETDTVINAVCALCRDHEHNGFIHGVQVGVRLAEELRGEGRYE